MLAKLASDRLARRRLLLLGETLPRLLDLQGFGEAKVEGIGPEVIELGRRSS